MYTVLYIQSSVKYMYSQNSKPKRCIHWIKMYLLHIRNKPWQM